MTRALNRSWIRTPLACALLALSFFGAPSLSAAPQPLPWDAFVNQFIEGYFRSHPPFAVRAGRHEYDGKLPDWRGEGLVREEKWLKTERQAVAQYGDGMLSESQRFELQYLLAMIDKDLFWLQSADSPYRNPMFYADALDPNVYVSRPYAPADRRLRSFIEYARNIPEATEQIRMNLRPPLPRPYIDIGKTVFGGLAKFYDDDAKAAFAEVADQGLQTQFDTARRRASKAMQNLADWLESQRVHAKDDFALGAERFQEMLKTTEGVELPLEVLERAGRRDLDRNLAALREECSRYAPGASIENCVAKVEMQKPLAGHLTEARQQLGTLKTFVAEKGVVSIPDTEEARVAESPPFSRWNTAYIDIPGPFDRGLPSVYYVAPPDPAWSAAEQAAYIPSKANLLFISAHEVWPGHFLQHLHANRAPGELGQLFSSYAFAEGWAHYAEEMMWEFGLNAGDAETHIGQLVNALLRNVRFLSAIGLHTQGMTIEASERMFREVAYCDAGNARQQAARGTLDPAYLNYTLGKLMIRKLRDDWTATRGGRAGWKPFHDAFLSYGAPPIPLVRKALLGKHSGSDL